MPALEFARREGGLVLGGGLAATGALMLALVGSRDALTGWLGAAVFIQALPVGALILLLIMRLVRGRWEDDLHGPASRLAALLPLAALAFLPVVVGMPAIYPWFHEPPASEFARLWLSPPFFVLRTAGWFVLASLVLRRALSSALSEFQAALGLIVLVLGSSATAVDWLMTLAPDFASSGFGLQLLTMEVCAALTALILLVSTSTGPRHTAVLGGLLLTLLLLWAYMQFFPFLIIWSGNLPDGAAWYLVRDTLGWNSAIIIAALLGGVPLLALLGPSVRANPRWLVPLSMCVLAGKAIEFAWFALPGRGPIGVFAFILALAGLGALSIAILLQRGRAHRRVTGP